MVQVRRSREIVNFSITLPIFAGIIEIIMKTGLIDLYPPKVGQLQTAHARGAVVGWWK